MADSYIDQFETIIYGLYARDQMAEVCLGLVPDLDGMVKYAIARQLLADTAMKAALDRQPRASGAVDIAATQGDARDVIVRFGSFLDSLKGRPVDPNVFFQNEVPSQVARRRLTKLTAAVAHIIEEIDRSQTLIRDAGLWRAEFVEIHVRLQAAERQLRSNKLDKAVLGPEVAAARMAWLEVYTANKHLIRGLLAHAGRPELMPLVFDDLAEVHRTSGVSDEPPGDEVHQPVAAPAVATA